jgi:hypothetical protein
LRNEHFFGFGVFSVFRGSAHMKLHLKSLIRFERSLVWPAAALNPACGGEAEGEDSKPEP